MCTKCIVEFEGCGHQVSKVVRCPTFDKQHSSAKGFLACLFQGHLRNRKDCGKVVPNWSRSRKSCQVCRVKDQRLRAKHVGDGAMRITRPVVEEDFRDERKHAAKQSLQKSEKHHRRGKNQHNHEVINARPSVWLPELYHHPETMARKEAYSRAAAPAPPVSSRPHKPSCRHPSSHGSEKPVRQGQLKKSYDYAQHSSAPGALSVCSERTPAFGSSEPLPRPAVPAPTHQYRGRFAGNAASLPPACGLPPTPPRPSVPASLAKSSRPPCQAGAPQGLRRKQGQVHTIVPSVMPKVPVPIPEYQSYLNAMSLAAKNSPSDTERIAQMVAECSPRKPHPLQSRYAIKKHPRVSALQQIGKSMGIEAPTSPFSDNGSDLSFVCQHARQISNLDPEKMVGNYGGRG